MKISPYLNFDGKAEEAFIFYKSIFGGEFSTLMRYKDMSSNENPVAEEEANRIMHISLPLGDDAVLMASDISAAQGMKIVEGNNNYISLQPDSVEQGRELFTKLSAGGRVEMPFEKMFWGDFFASFADKFGILWMINVEDKK